ncbi:kinase-like domain-containing protein [Kalaharituber pfeilii]|nr:kinase-like domain-containing protein [Kalaharituber pfeilii]
MSTLGHNCFEVAGQPFFLYHNFAYRKVLGEGSLRIVCLATNTATEDTFAVKKITNSHKSTKITKRMLREITLLMHLRGHSNIIYLYHFDAPVKGDVYLYQEVMITNLATEIGRRYGEAAWSFENIEIKSIMYQLLCGLQYIYSAGIMHRDLKPANLVLNNVGELKICDFRLGRGTPELLSSSTPIIATR